MRLFQTVLLWALSVLPLFSQQVLTLEDCRQLALDNNKQLTIGRAKQSLASDLRKAARTKYLPKVDALAGYEYTSREVSLLTNSQKDFLSNLGSNAVGKVTEPISAIMTEMVQQGLLRPEDVQAIQERVNPVMNGVAEKGNAIGQDIRDAFRTNTHHLFAGSVMIRQPLYMGGAITALNNIAALGEEFASTDLDLRRQSTLYGIEEAYWLVVSLRHKQRLARSFYALVKQLNDDVHKMIDEGVATRADGLKVDVKVNEAEMTKTQVDNGLSLARMLLCQLCGIQINDKVTLVDETRDDIAVAPAGRYNKQMAMESRPELKLLNNAVELSEQTTTIARATMLPQVALTGCFHVSNPNLYNGFEKKFGGIWTVGIMVRVPVLDWGGTIYKVRASKIATNIARLTLDEAREKIDLQVNQCDYRLKEANKKLVTAQKNIQRAEENLRCANVGFKEGVMDATEVMAAQTAWLQAKTQKIDAQIDVCLGEAAMKKAIGVR